MNTELMSAKIEGLLEALEAEDRKLKANPRLRTPYPATDINGFFRLVGQVITEQQKAEGVKNPLLYVEDMPELDDNISSEIISYGLRERRPGVAEQVPQGRAMMDRQIRERVKIYRESFPDPENPGLKIYSFGSHFDNIVEFKIWAKTNKTANARALWFEDLIEQWRWYFEASGIKRISYEKREADVHLSPENVKLVCRPLIYYVRTEKITLLKEYTLRSLIVGNATL